MKFFTIPSSAVTALSVLFGLSAITSCGTTQGSSTKTSGAKTGQELFRSEVKPLIESRCVWCHSNRETRGGLNFQNRDLVLASPRRFIVPGNSSASLIYRAVTLDSAHPKVMPGDGWGISAEQAEALRKWIDAGAPWPEGRQGRLKRKPYRVGLDHYL